jgi:hypothetical protein
MFDGISSTKNDKYKVVSNQQNPEMMTGRRGQRDKEDAATPYMTHELIV